MMDELIKEIKELNLEQKKAVLEYIRQIIDKRKKVRSDETN